MNTAAAPKLEKRPAQSSYRWWIMMIVCLAFGVSFMCRNNLGVMIPSLRAEFHLSATAAGSIASIFFLGYVIASIPGAFVLSKYGPRKFIAATIFIFSGIMAALGASASVLHLLVFRFFLGVFESPTPIGVTATLKNWFPPKERGRAMGVFTALPAMGVAVGAPVTVWLMGIGGWRWGFYGMAVPGFLIGAIWLVFMRAYPSESRFCSPAEADYINAAGGGQVKLPGSLGWIDNCLRLHDIPPIENKWHVFISKNVLTMAAIYFTVSVVNYGIMTWLPSFLVFTKHYSFVKTGWVAASCGVGQFVGHLGGGWMSDYIFLSRMKPTILISTVCTAICMWVVIHSPNNAAIVGIILFMTGLLFGLGHPSCFAYTMSITRPKAYPISHSVTSMVGNFGSFLTPMLTGLLIDKFHNYEVVFASLGIASLVGFFLTAFVLDEPRNPA